MSGNYTAPEGFTEFDGASPFMDRSGPFYVSGTGDDLIVGAFVNDYNVNHAGIAHGGFIATLADAGLGYAYATLSDPPAGALTLNLNVDYTGTARLGDWIETHVDLHKPDGRIVFANAFLYCNGKSIARANAILMRSEANIPRKP